MVSINRLESIWTQLARSVCYAKYVSEEDLSSFSRRNSAEGYEFSARGLAKLRLDLLTGLETGQLVVSARFGPKRGSVLPRFLYGAWKCVFSDEGTLLEQPETQAVSCLNQLLAVFSKINGAHTPESEKRVLDSFVSLETELRTTPIDLDTPFQNSRKNPEWILDAASKLCRRVLAGENPREITPRHGSGSCANGLRVHERYETFRYVEAIDKLWPYSEFWFASANHLCEEMEKLQAAEVYEPCAKVLLVPKDARGPRLISCEPSETMWIQQGLMQKLYNCIESHPLTRGSVNFTDQRPNQVAAYEGSKDLSIATLDLSEASDRVRLDIVTYLLPPNWAEAIVACRSSKTRLPDGREVLMTKHAPMGSALCFPIMALVIWSILTVALPPGSKILVYGDDITVPTDCYPLAVEVLERYHLKVNQHKSYYKGSFRESCGKEYYRGIDITPVRVRREPTDDMRSRAATIAFANNLALKFGMPQEWIIELVHEWYRAVPEDCYDANHANLVIASYNERNGKLSWKGIDDMVLSTVLFVFNPTNKHLKTRWNPRLYRREYRILVPQAVTYRYVTDNSSCLFRALVNPRREQLGTDALPKRVRYKYGWMPLRS